MDSLSELCRGFSVPSIDILARGDVISDIHFGFPYTYFQNSNSKISMNAITNFRRQFAVNTKWVPPFNIHKRQVKLSLSLERKLNGYVSIKL